MRGENRNLIATRQLKCGTSPHAWGKPLLERAAAVADRNIPTCVGKTRRRSYPFLRRPEHPHMRGENASSDSSRETTDGTSPHAWGKPTFGSAPPEVSRNIPTCVGKTGSLREFGRVSPEHPHMRGENSAGYNIHAAISGTSPHAWGKRSTRAQATTRPRNIPTCVGKTLCTKNSKKD